MSGTKVVEDAARVGGAAAEKGGTNAEEDLRTATDDVNANSRAANGEAEIMGRSQGQVWEAATKDFEKIMPLLAPIARCIVSADCSGFFSAVLLARPKFLASAIRISEMDVLFRSSFTLRSYRSEAAKTQNTHIYFLSIIMTAPTTGRGETTTRSRPQ
jgi:hypothetical protein